MSHNLEKINKEGSAKEYSIDITFFIPCFNEESNIKPTILNIVKAMEEFSLNYEIIVMDDASTDNSLQKLKRIKYENPDFPLTIKINQNNKGLGFNYFRCSFFAKGQYYMLVNGDNVELVEGIIKLIGHCGEADMIIPYYGSNEKRSAFRKIVSRSYTKLINAITGNKIKYYNGSILHRTDNIRYWQTEATGFGYQAELVCRLLQENMSYLHVNVPQALRQHGSSKAFKLSNILSVLSSLFNISKCTSKNRMS